MAINNPIANLFGSSPIKPIQHHMAVVAQAVTELESFFDNVIHKNWAAADEYHANIKQHKDNAATIIRELRMNMPKGLFMPVSRTDLLTIIETQQQIAFLSLDITALVLERQFDIPKKLHSPLRKLVKTAVLDNLNARNAINELDELLEGGFSGHVTKVLKKRIKQINNQHVKVQNSAKNTRLQLIQLENTMSPIDVMFLYKVIKQITDIAHQSKDIGSYLELLIAK